MKRIWKNRELIWEQAYPAVASVGLAAICAFGKQVSLLESLLISAFALVFALREDMCWHAMHDKYPGFIKSVDRTKSYRWMEHMHNRVRWMCVGMILELIFLGAVHNIHADFAISMLQTVWLLFVFLTILYSRQMIVICCGIDRTNPKSPAERLSP